jgi:hypothetical protein
MHVRYGPASTEQVLGALPVVAAVCRRLDIAGIVDRAPRRSGTSPTPPTDRSSSR